jgi:phospholipid/cholesterol/gamma-HCH transport system permease protein
MIARAFPSVALSGQPAGAGRLFSAVLRAVRPSNAHAPEQNVLRALLERSGRGLVRLGQEGLATVSFLGEALAALANVVIHPRRIRWIANVMEEAGLNAMPVIAYLGARTLSDFGVSVFTVELVGFSVLREFAIVITAVVLAGRTDSAFTAEIGAMKMRQEIDAMRVMGFDPVETLVVPRVIAMLAMTPILTFAAMLAGLFGGWLACWAYLHVSPTMFLQRLHDGVRWRAIFLAFRGR